eukprot:9792907-Ditylum_brightwellii.AAC.1
MQNAQEELRNEKKKEHRLLDPRTGLPVGENSSEPEETGTEDAHALNAIYRARQHMAKGRLEAALQEERIAANLLKNMDHCLDSRASYTNSFIAPGLNGDDDDDEANSQ